ncbi:HAMP domain-containing sensor histidine kinase [Variovorax sp. J22P240]|uniref:sensor histidine kinase n=1 Tax=Variovorax sp. J22P240 TaxID=3053514 RepID=UPI002578E94C|nr:HAMP domain-containing sensor histidine kinase [Variovorax sp. J22P240]MDM0001056.1 HAMP domain-containing sensor histidine kinase [Variovorax sp. J22P240]
MRCATRDRVLAVVSHELRQPLNVIQMNAKLLTRLPASTAPTHLRRIADAIQRAIESQARIINDLLDVSRVRTGKLTLHRAEVNFGKLVMDLVAALSANWSPGRVTTEVRASSPLVCYADALRLEQIVGNLLDNAVKFSPAGGRILVRLLSEGGFARISVVDCGRGIAPDFLPDVFGLFSQAGASVGEGLHGGLGVGLALVHGLAAAHGGFVKATSAGINQGAEFSVWLPLHPSATPADTSSAHADHSSIASP